MTPRQIVLGADVATGLVAVSIAAAVGGLVWHAMMPVTETRAIATRRLPVADAIDLEPIATLAPFGSPAPAAADGSGQALLLRGIMLASPATLSTALIADGQGHVLAYRIGQALPNGATLVAIARDQVTLQGSAGPVRLGFAHAGASADIDSDADVTVGSEPASASGTHAEAATPAGQTVNQPTVVEVGSDQPPSGSSPAPLSGAAAIRALIPPSVSGIGPAHATAPGQAGHASTSEVHNLADPDGR